MYHQDHKKIQEGHWIQSMTGPAVKSCKGGVQQDLQQEVKAASETMIVNILKMITVLSQLRKTLFVSLLYE